MHREMSFYTYSHTHIEAQQSVKEEHDECRQKWCTETRARPPETVCFVPTVLKLTRSCKKS